VERVLNVSMKTHTDLLMEFFKQQRALSADAVESLTYIGFEKLAVQFENFQKLRSQADPLPLLKWHFCVLQRIKLKCAEVEVM